MEFNFIFAVLITIFTAWFAYMSAHCVEEQRQGKNIRLPWEKKTIKQFDKSDIEYRDGDNT
jgi:hypothetical protein